MSFSFENCSANGMAMEISKFSTSKSCPINTIPAKMIKSNRKFFTTLLHGTTQFPEVCFLITENLLISPLHTRMERPSV